MSEFAQFSEKKLTALMHAACKNCMQHRPIRADTVSKLRNSKNFFLVSLLVFFCMFLLPPSSFAIPFKCFCLLGSSVLNTPFSLSICLSLGKKVRKEFI